MKYLIETILAFFVASLSSSAQISEPSITPPMNGQPTEALTLGEKNSNKLGSVRLWNFSYLRSIPRIAVFLGAPGEKMPSFEKRLWIARGSRSPDRRNWFEVPPGNYEIFVLEDDAVAGNMGVKIGPAATPSASLLHKRLGIKIEADSHQTIILFQKDKHLEARAIDEDSSVGVLPHLRVFTFESIIKPTISLLGKTGEKKVLAKDVSQEGIDLEIGELRNPLTFEVAYLFRPDFIARQNVEMDFTGYRSCSLIFAPDRYGAMSVDFTNDAPIPPVETPKL